MPVQLRTTLIQLLASSLLLVLPGSGWAETFYKWQNEEGSWVYGAHPPAGVEAVEVKTNIGRPSRSESAQASGDAPAAPAEAGGAAPQLEVETKPEIPEAQRKQYCQQGRQNLEALSSKAVIRQRDADGNVTVLSDEDREAEIEKARRAVEKYC